MILLAACGEPAPPALTVGSIAFAESELLGLTESRRQSLAELAALALAVADSSTTQLGAPLVGEWTEDRLLEILAAELTLEKNAVSEGALLEVYGASPAWELTVRHLLVFSERWRETAHRTAARQKAGRALAMLRDGADFPDVEARLATEGGYETRQGLMPPGREGTWVSEFWAAALALEPGELSPVTETQYGFHVLRLEARAPVAFSEARSAVARRVARSIEDPRTVLDAWMADRGDDGTLRRAAALAEARTRGLVVPEAERAEMARLWEDQVAGWAATLGFRYGLTPARAGEAALAALAATGQGADIARREISAHSDLLRARYEIRLGTAPGAEP
jgi:hypothetical protein